MLIIETYQFMLTRKKKSANYFHNKWWGGRVLPYMIVFRFVHSWCRNVFAGTWIFFFAFFDFHELFLVLFPSMKLFLVINFQQKWPPKCCSAAKIAAIKPLNSATQREVLAAVKFHHRWVLKEASSRYRSSKSENIRMSVYSMTIIPQIHQYNHHRPVRVEGVHASLTLSPLFQIHSKSRW